MSDSPSSPRALRWLTWVFEISPAGFVVSAKPHDCGLTRCFNVSFRDFIVGFQCDPPKLARPASVQNGALLKGGAVI